MVLLPASGVRIHTFRAVVYVIGCLLYVVEATYYDYFGDKVDFTEHNSTLDRE